ncbi:MAG: hypothetical protein EXR55_00610 [Dehalococcoidia bacterium]|nr:hypothetical protein [Dehalococcoidia bacterium]
MWQAIWGIFGALLVTGLAMVAVGLTALGAVMLGTPVFGNRVGWLSVTIGVLGTAASVVLLIDPASPIAVVNVLSLIVFHLVLGWKLFSLSRARRES